MPTSQVPIIKGDKVSQNFDYRDALMVNLIGIPRQIFGTAGYLRSHSGLEQFADGKGKDRGAVFNDRFNKHYRVSGSSLIEVSNSGDVTVIGGIGGNDQASMPYSFNNQCIVATGAFYLYNDTDGLRRIEGDNVGQPIDACFVDQYFVFTDGEFLYHTKATSEEKIDPLDFATPEIQPDRTLGVERDYSNLLMAFGRFTVEYFSNDASANFAFTRVPSRAKNVGIVGTHCKTMMANGWCILGGSKKDQTSAYWFSGSSTQKIATREIDKIIDQYSESQLSKVVIESRMEDNIELAIYRLPNETLVYNHTLAQAQGLSFAWSVIKNPIQTGGKWSGANGIYDHRASSYIYGDSEESRIGKLNPDIPTIYGEQVESIFYSPFIYLDKASIDEVDFRTTPGDPTEAVNVFVSLTYNGITYGREYAMNYGRAYGYDKSFTRYRFGYVDDFVGFKFRAVSKSVMTFARFDLTYG